MACFHCECKRPSDEFMENKMQEKQRGPSTRLERTAHRQEVSNAWNFDFDDNESDGADVAAFEYADSSVVAEDSPLDNQAHGGNFRGPEGNFSKASRVPRVHEKEYSDGDTNRPGMGFDDFEDEEDNIDSYELEIPHNNSARKASSNEFSEAEGYSGSEDFEGINNNVPDQVPHLTISHLNLCIEMLLSLALRMIWFQMKIFQFIPTGNLVMLLILDREVEVEVKQVPPRD